MQNAMDIANRVGNFNFNDEMMVLFKTWMKYGILIGKNANQNPIHVEEAENGQAENGNP